MADIYDRARATAIRMLAPRPAGKGLEMTLRARASATYAPGGDGAIGATTDHTGSGVRTSYSAKDVDGTIIRRDDVRIILSPDGIPEPVPGDVIVFDGSTYTVIAVDAWNYAGLFCGYSVQARK